MYACHRLVVFPEIHFVPVHMEHVLLSQNVEGNRLFHYRIAFGGVEADGQRTGGQQHQGQGQDEYSFHVDSPFLLLAHALA